MKKETKDKQIVVRFDKSSFDSINERAKLEHRGLGEFVRHAALVYIDICNTERDTSFFARLPLNQIKTSNYSEME